MEKIRKRGILAVSFGTSYEDSCRQTIGALEEDFAENFPGMPVKRAFTSSVIMRIWEERGVHIPDVQDALRELAAEHQSLMHGQGDAETGTGRFLSSPPIYWREKSMKSCAPRRRSCAEAFDGWTSARRYCIRRRICTELQIFMPIIFQEKRAKPWS